MTQKTLLRSMMAIFGHGSMGISHISDEKVCHFPSPTKSIFEHTLFII